jgi:hypothetical protein
MKMDLRNIYGTVIFSAAVSTIKDLVIEAIKQHANLRGADLHDANLYDANLYGANLYGANLHGANLYDANLRGAERLSELAEAESRILPEGILVGWKKCRNSVIVKLMIPQKAKRSNATGRKCRASEVKVLQVFGASEGVSQQDEKVIYRKGETVTCDKWDDNRWNECSGGIHFFLSRIEAENY